MLFLCTCHFNMTAAFLYTPPLFTLLLDLGHAGAYNLGAEMTWQTTQHDFGSSSGAQAMTGLCVRCRLGAAACRSLTPYLYTSVVELSNLHARQTGRS